MINHVSDQLLEEWRINRPDIVIADFITLSAGFVAEELEIPLDYHHGKPNLQSKLLMVLLASSEGWGIARTKKEEKIQALCRKLTRIGKYCGAFLLRKRLKRYNFKLYNQNGVETIYSPSMPSLELV